MEKAITIVNLEVVSIEEDALEMDLFADELDQRLNAGTVSSSTCISSASCGSSCASCACCFSSLCCYSVSATTAATS